MKILIIAMIMVLIGCNSEYSDDVGGVYEPRHCSELTVMTSVEVDYATVNDFQVNTCNSITGTVVLNRGEEIDNPDDPFLLSVTKAVSGLAHNPANVTIRYDGYVLTFIDRTGFSVGGVELNYHYRYELGDNFISKRNSTTGSYEYINDDNPLFSELLGDVLYGVVHAQVMEAIASL